MAIIKVHESQIRSLVGVTDWDRVRALTDEEIHEAIKSDPDAREFMPHELAQFKRGNLQQILNDLKAKKK